MSCSTPIMLLLAIFHLLSIVTSASNSSDLLYEIEKLIRVYKDGRVERLSGTDIVPPSLDPTTGVLSKDITIDPELSVSARLFLPQNAAVCNKLPLLIYFHGGGFFTDSPSSSVYHNHLISLVAKADVVAVSVNYRLAPEHYLPAAYGDSWLALKWVFSHHRGRGTEAWLRSHVDFGRVYLGGDSAGANIAHNMAIRVGLEGGIGLRGMFLNCPHFWGSEVLEGEANNPGAAAWVESIWIHAYPNSTGFDDPLSNPAKDPNIGKLGCKKVLVYVAELDVLRGRGWYYRETLKKSKWGGTVEVVEVKGVRHVFNLGSPNHPEARKMVENVALFLNNDVLFHSGTRLDNVNRA